MTTKIGFYVSVKNGLLEPIRAMASEVIPEYKDARIFAQDIRNTLVEAGYKKLTANFYVKDAGRTHGCMEAMRELVSIAVVCIAYNDGCTGRVIQTEKIIYDYGYYQKPE